ncbi:hypothetical protein LCGC14_2885790, partial [marine sediment metagenome]
QFRDGSLVTGDITSLYNSWLRAGKVWEAHFATESGTATVENNTAIDLTEPFFRMAVKAGKVIVPISVKFAKAVVWETGDEVVVIATDTDAAASGGVAPDIRNLAIGTANTQIGDGDNGVQNPLDGDSPITEGAITRARVLDNHHFVTGQLGTPYEYNALKGDGWSMIEGEGTFLVYVANTTTTDEVFYSVKWAVLDSGELV